MTTIERYQESLTVIASLPGEALIVMLRAVRASRQGAQDEQEKAEPANRKSNTQK